MIVFGIVFLVFNVFLFILIMFLKLMNVKNVRMVLERIFVKVMGFVFGIKVVVIVGRLFKSGRLKVIMMSNVLILISVMVVVKIIFLCIFN